MIASTVPIGEIGGRSPSDARIDDRIAAQAFRQTCAFRDAVAKDDNRMGSLGDRQADDKLSELSTLPQLAQLRPHAH